MGQCKNCKYWAPEDGTLGLCNGIETSAYYDGQEDNVQISYISEGNPEFGVNYNEWQLTTRDTFGCLNFEEEK